MGRRWQVMCLRQVGVQEGIQEVQALDFSNRPLRMPGAGCHWRDADSPLQAAVQRGQVRVRNQPERLRQGPNR